MVNYMAELPDGHGVRLVQVRPGRAQSHREQRSMPWGMGLSFRG